MCSDDDTHRWVGCPIRISTDQRLLAAPHGFSQRATSFIASWCQGIHRMPFSRSHAEPTRQARSAPHHAREPATHTRPRGSRRQNPTRLHTLKLALLNEIQDPSNTFDGNPTCQTRSDRSDTSPMKRTRTDSIANEHTTLPQRCRTGPITFPGPIEHVRWEPVFRNDDPSGSPATTARIERTRYGDDRDRTDDPLLAKQVLSQLSYAPTGEDRTSDMSPGGPDPPAPRPSSDR